MFSKRRITFSREGLYYLVVLSFIVGGAVLRQINLLIILAGMMLGPLFYSWRAVAGAIRRVEPRRIAPDGVCAGDPLVVDITVTNRHRRKGAWSLVVEDRIRREGAPRSEDRTRIEVFFPYVSAGQTETIAYRGAVPRRGKYTLGPLRVSTRFPFGLIRGSRVVAEQHELLVFPQLGRLGKPWSRLLDAGETDGESRRSRQGNRQGDYYGLRDWRAGDSKSWIHWRTTARRAKISVREFEHQQNQDLALLVDLWRPERPTEEDNEIVERAVSFAATACHDRCMQGGSRLWIATAGATDAHGNRIELLQGPASQMLLRDIMEHLAVVEADSHDQLEPLLSRALREAWPSARLVLLTTRPDDDKSLQAALEKIRRDPPKAEALRGLVNLTAHNGQLSRLFEVAP